MSPRSNLTKQLVVQSAVELINNEGLEALSLNRLADRLGIRTPSLYNHVDGLPGLRRELSLLNARYLAERLSDAAIGQSGPELVMTVMQAYRAYIKEFTGLYMSTLRVSGAQDVVDPELQKEEARSLKVALAVVASFGLEGENAIHAVRGLRSLVHGFATLEISGGFGMPFDLDESFARLVELFIAGLQRPEVNGNSQ
jgi:AcrR family transcriptional regulator